MGEVRVVIAVENEKELNDEVQLFVDRLGTLFNPREGITNAAHPKLFLKFLKLLEDDGINVFNIVLHTSSWKYTPAAGTFNIPIKLNLDPGFVKFMSTVTIDRYGDGPQEFNLVSR